MSLLGNAKEEGSRFVWNKVPSSKVALYLSGLGISPVNQGFLPDAKTGELPLIAFIKENGVSALESWDVCLVQGSGPASQEIAISIGGGKVKYPAARLRSFEALRSRSASAARINKHRLGEAGDERVGLLDDEVAQAEDAWRKRQENDTKSIPGGAYRLQRTSPLMVIHLIKAKGSEDDPKKKTAPISDVGEEVKVAISLSFPAYTDSESTEVTYRVNRVYLDNLGLGEEEEDGDE